MSVGRIYHMLVHEVHFTVPRKTAGKGRRLLPSCILYAAPEIVTGRFMAFVHEAPELGLDIMSMDHVVYSVSRVLGGSPSFEG